jgi:hypothetical protein
MPASDVGVCSNCGGAVREGWRVCPACLTPLQAGTETEYKPSTSSSGGAEEGRFAAGTVLAGRYRIMGLLGRGGMGEVYRAYDLILNQAVALKFLSGVALNEAAHARFRNEVRIARQVSHPNVCRVYDIGVIEGMHFLSMEYIDGEDLQSLLHRIGRLPQDKATEFARRICAGLSAAHERGVLHRDLKPANIMIDGRGQVRITDFGLAAFAVEIPLTDLRSGTPAYMSPEQKAGQEVTPRSDVYSLGLVLHEMFTGQRRTDAATQPTDLVKDLDPAIERLILRCLEEDPKRRPSSALNVARALPGGDPIAAALAAGETPSPEMVAASEEMEGFSRRTAVACFVGVLVLLAVISVVTGRVSVLARAPLEIPPDGLAFRARQILTQLGYGEEPRQTAYGFDCCDVSYLRLTEQYDRARRDAILASHRPAVIRFWYRQHQSEIRADSFIVTTSVAPFLPLNGVILNATPANTEPGMIRLALDAKGRLIALEARPPASRGPSTGNPAKVPDWAALFSAAGLDAARFTPVAPQITPPLAFDANMAWTGTFEEGRPEQVRLEAASWEGRPVYFDLRGDWQQPANAAAQMPALAVTAPLVFLVAVVLAGAAMVRHNLRLGRGDLRAASKLAAIAFAAVMSVWVLTASHVPGIWEMVLFLKGLCFATFVAGLLWVFYLALEPNARRHWPDALISWTRLQTGRTRDPLVASHVLAGGLGYLAAMTISLGMIWALGSGKPILLPRIEALNSAAYSLAFLSFEVTRSLGVGLFILLNVILMRRLTRRLWIADVLWAVLFGLIAPRFWVSNFALSGAYNTLIIYAVLWVHRRFGLLALWTGMFLFFVLSLPVSLTSWYAGQSLAILLIPASMAGWALWVILSAPRRA